MKRCKITIRKWGTDGRTPHARTKTIFLVNGFKTPALRAGQKLRSANRAKRTLKMNLSISSPRSRRRGQGNSSSNINYLPPATTGARRFVWFRVVHLHRIAKGKMKPACSRKDELTASCTDGEISPNFALFEYTPRQTFFDASDNGS